MGLRFRRSVKICKGVRLNFGKTGASLSLGTTGLRKTFHTSGKVTTTVGLPGTGIYWTETTNPNRRSDQNNVQRNSNQRESSRIDNSISSSLFEQSPTNNERNETDSSSRITMHSNSSNVDVDSDWEDLCIHPTTENNAINSEQISKIKNIYKNADYPIDWIDVSNSESATELEMGNELWQYCKQVSESILDGNIETYLDVIETLRPVDDLLLYAGDFEFGTDKSNTMCVEFVVKENELFNSEFKEEYINAVSVRIARDLIALLPISKVEIKSVDVSDIEISNIIFEKRKLKGINYHSMSATDIVALMK